jgi:hypothetical protein
LWSRERILHDFFWHGQQDIHLQEVNNLIYCIGTEVKSVHDVQLEMKYVYHRELVTDYEITLTRHVRILINYQSLTNFSI